MANAVEPARQDVKQEAADELVDAERHDLLAVRTIAAIVLVAEGDAGLVEGEQPAVQDGDAVSIAGEIGEHCFGADEGRLGVDHPALMADRREVAQESPPVGEWCEAAEEAKPAGSWRAISLARNRRRNSLPRTRIGRKNAGREEIQRCPSRVMPPPGTIMCTVDR